MSKKAIWIFVGIFLAYFIFTSGFYYWVSGCNETARLITPYSFALSAEEKGFTGITTKSDMDCIRWLLEESNPNFKIAGDSNTIYLLIGHFVLNDTESTRPISLEQFYEAEHCYLLLTQQNIRDGVLISPVDVGLRARYPFTINSGVTVFDEAQQNRRIVVHEVYRSGDSVVVEK
jgi:uncharacterized membrane protein